MMETRQKSTGKKKAVQEKTPGKHKDLPKPGELTKQKENPKAGNIGKNNAGGYR